MVITPQYTEDSGLFLFASIEHGNPVLLESVRSVFIHLVWNKIKDIKDIYLIINQHLIRLYEKNNTFCCRYPIQTVIGKAEGNKIKFIADRGVYLWSPPYDEFKYIAGNNPGLGQFDFDIFSNNSIHEEEVEITSGTSIYIIPYYLEYMQRYVLQDCFNWGWGGEKKRAKLRNDDMVSVVGGEEVLFPLLMKDSYRLPSNYFTGCFVNKINFNKVTENNIFEYIFAFEILNKGTSKKFLEENRNYTIMETYEYFLCSNIELSCLKNMLDPNIFISVKKVKHKTDVGEILKYKIELSDAIFPKNNDFEDLAVLRITR